MLILTLVTITLIIFVVRSVVEVDAWPSYKAVCRDLSSMWGGFLFGAALVSTEYSLLGITETQIWQLWVILISLFVLNTAYSMLKSRVAVAQNLVNKIFKMPPEQRPAELARIKDSDPLLYDSVQREIAEIRRTHMPHA
jgi:hypothetical protein